MCAPGSQTAMAKLRDRPSPTFSRAGNRPRTRMRPFGPPRRNTIQKPFGVCFPRRRASGTREKPRTWLGSTRLSGIVSWPARWRPPYSTKPSSRSTRAESACALPAKSCALPATSPSTPRYRTKAARTTRPPAACLTSTKGKPCGCSAASPSSTSPNRRRVTRRRPWCVSWRRRALAGRRPTRPSCPPFKIAATWKSGKGVWVPPSWAWW